MRGRSEVRAKPGSVVLVALLCASLGCGGRTGLDVGDTAPPPDEPLSCVTGFADCDSEGWCATDLGASAENCGACGNVCPADLVCGAGMCRSPKDIIQVAAGYDFTCGLRASGEVLCWGGNEVGQLGDGTLDPHTTPAPVVGLTDAVHLDTPHRGYEQTMCAVRASGIVSCWGAGTLGQLGNGANEDQPVPVDVIGVEGAASVALGIRHACALLRDGSASCWGSNLPYCFIRASGAVTCAGSNAHGKIDADLEGDVPFDEMVAIDGVTDAIEISATDYSTCALRANGQLLCWGDNETGLLGIGSSEQPDEKINGVPGLNDVVDVGAGRYHVCVARGSNGAACWGSNNQGQLGDGTTEHSPAPVPVLDLP